MNHIWWFDLDGDCKLNPAEMVIMAEILAGDQNAELDEWDDPIED